MITKPSQFRIRKYHHRENISKKEIIFYNEINKLLRNGKIVQMYPEGSLWPYYDKIRNFKYGAFKMAVEANVPIQPIVFKYVNKWYKRKPAIVCEVLKPIYPNNKLKKELMSN